MNKTLVALGALAVTLAAYTVAIAPVVAQEASPVVTPSSLEETDPAVRHYLCSTLAATFERMADEFERSEGSSMDLNLIAFKAMASISDMPVESLPEEHQAFARESYATSRPYEKEIAALLTELKNGAISEEEMCERMETLAQQMHEAQMEVEAKYPESAKVLGLQATQNLTEEISQLYGEEMMDGVLAYLEEHPEAEGDQKQLLTVSFRLMAKLFKDLAAEASPR